MKDTMKRAAKFALGAALVLNFTACGTILHPERKGQTQGPIDVGVAVLDGIGLLFFIIPGVIAYAVDFSNGTIYLPSGEGRGKGKKKAMREIHFDPKAPRIAELERVLSRETGRRIELADAKGYVVPLSMPQQLPPFFAGAVVHVPQTADESETVPSSGR